MRRACLPLIVTSLLVWPVAGAALELKNRAEALIYDDYRHVNQESLSEIHDPFEQYVLLGSQLRLREADFQLEVRPEIRGVISRGAGAAATDPARVTIRSPRRLVNLDYKIHAGPHDEWYGDFERLNLSYSVESLEAYVGRKPVSLGVLKVLPIWNKFTIPLPNAGGPQLVFSQDVVGARYQQGTFAAQAIDIEQSRREVDSVRLAEAVLYSPVLEAHLSVAHWWDELVIGGAFTKDLGGATLRGEALWIGVNPSDTDRQAQGGLGAEYAVSEKLSLTVESMFLSRGATTRNDYGPVIPSRFMPLRAFAYGYFQAQYNLTSLWTVAGATLLNFVDVSNLIIAKAIYSLSDEAELHLDLQLPAGRERSEFSRKTLIFPASPLYPSGASVGAPLQISASVRIFF